MTERAPVVAGLFYPASASELRKEIESCFSDKKFGPGNNRAKPEKIIAGIAPHAGYIYSGACGAHLYSRIPRDTKTVVILGPNHTGRGSGISASDADFWETPLGKVGVDCELRQKILDNSKIIDCEGGAHAGEHSIEVHLPFLQTVLPDFKIVPICMMGGCDAETCSEVGGAIAKAVSGMKNVFLLASTDFSHYVSRQEAEMKDGMAIDRILKLDPQSLLETVEKLDISMCGPMTVASVLFAAKALGAKKAELLRHYTSGDITGDYSQGVVGYASLSVE